MPALRPWLLLALGCACAGAMAAEPGLDAQEAMRVSQGAIGRKLGDYAFSLPGGRQVRLADYRGKPLLVSFVYTGCTSACPLTTRQVAAAVRAARAVVGTGAFHVLSIGFNLPQDSPEAMRDHALRFGLAGPGWDFVSPQPAQLRALLADFGFSYVPTSWGYDHIAQVSVVDADGRIYRQVYGDVPVQRLTDPLKELIEGTPLPRGLADIVERVRVLCTVYDPRTNTYRFKTTIVGELVSFAALTAALGWFVWRERRRRRAPR
jgi:protein SCO1/2